MNRCGSFRNWVSGFVAHAFLSQPNLSVIGGNGVMQRLLCHLKSVANGELVVSDQTSFLLNEAWDRG